MIERVPVQRARRPGIVARHGRAAAIAAACSFAVLTFPAPLIASSGAGKITAEEAKANYDIVSSVAQFAPSDITELHTYVQSCPEVAAQAPAHPQVKGGWDRVLTNQNEDLEGNLEKVDEGSPVADWASGLASRASAYSAAQRPLIREGSLDLTLGISELYDGLSDIAQEVDDLKAFNCTSSKLDDATASLGASAGHLSDGFALLSKALVNDAMGGSQ